MIHHPGAAQIHYTAMVLTYEFVHGLSQSILKHHRHINNVKNLIFTTGTLTKQIILFHLNTIHSYSLFIQVSSF